MRNIHYLLLILIFFTNFVTAQTTNITGYIKTSDGKPAESVNVSIKETKYKTVTNELGQFEFKNIKKGNYVLITSLVGLESQEVNFEVIEGRVTMIPEIILFENSTTLTEVLIQSQKGYLRKTSENVNRLSIRNIENPQSVQIIDQQLMKDRQIQTVGEATKSMVGVNAFSSSQYSDYTLRGFRSTAGNFAYNGIRGDFFGFDQASLTYNLESIEAIKGPASVLFSSGNPGGVINHVTKKAKAKASYEAEITYGSFDQKRIMLDATGAVSKNKKLVYRAIIGYEKTGQLDVNQEIENLFLAPQLQYNFNDNTTVNFELNYSNDKRTMGYQRGIAALYDPANETWNLERYPIDLSMIDPDGFSKSENLSNQLTFNHRFSNKLKLTVLARTNHSKQLQIDMAPLDFAIGAVDDLLTFENRYYKPEVNNYQVSAFANYDFSTARINHKLVFGTDFSSIHKKNDYISLESRKLNLLNLDFSWGVTDEAAFLSMLPSASYQSGTDDKTILNATYIQDQISFSEKLKLMLGVRYETHQYNVSYSDLITNEITGSDNLKASQIVPRAGIVYLPNQNTSVYANYSQGFQPQFGSNIEAGGPFPPEKSRQYEVGSKKEWLNNRLSTSVALYYIQKFDVLTLDPTDPDGIRQIQMDKIKSKGIELSLQGKITNNLDAIVNYAYNEARTPGDTGFDYNNPGWFPNAPNTNTNAWLKYTLNRGVLKNLSVGAGFNYIGKRNTLVANFILPDYTTFDAAVSYKIKGFTINVNVYNLTDVRYYNGAYGPSNLFPGNPLSFRTTLNYAF